MAKGRALTKCLCLLAIAILLNGCVMCTYDTVSTPHVVGSTDIDTHRRSRSKALFLEFDDFDMSVEMYNVIPASHDLFVVVLLPIPSTNAKAMPNIDRTRVWLRFFSRKDRSDLKETGISIRSSDISLTIDGREEYPAKAIEVLGRDESGKKRGVYENGIITAYDSAIVELDFDLDWKPKSKYILTVKQMTYKGSAIIPPQIKFSKSSMTRKCDSAP